MAETSSCRRQSTTVPISFGADFPLDQGCATFGTVTSKTLYDEDFYAWTQHQAALLRRLSPAGNELDLEHIAEEIEDLGRSDLRAARSLCQRKALSGASFRSAEQLTQAIRDFTAAYNETAAPFVWRKREVKGSQLRHTIVNLRN